MAAGLCRILDSPWELCYKRRPSKLELEREKSMARVRTIVAFCIFFLAGSVLAQSTGRIAGRVTREDGSGLSGVIVSVSEISQATVTDANGNYSFNNVPAGRYTVVFTAGDQADTLTDVTVAGGATARTDKQVDWQLTLAESITVYSASRRTERIVEAPAAITIVTEEELEAEAATGQLPKVLESAPGVDFTQSGLYDFNFNTRGFNSSLNRRILTLIDGRDPSVPFLGAQEWAALSFPIDEMASVELVRGPGAALYGANAFNGVLNMVTKQPRYSLGGKAQLSGGDLATGRLDIRQAGPIAGEWFYRVVGGYQTSDDFALPRNAGVEYGTNPAGCGPGVAGCLPAEGVPLVLTEDEILFAGLRLDRYFGDTAALTFEGGYATLEGPIFQTGIGRVQVTDVQRPWVRANYNRPHWNVLTYWDSRNADAQKSLGAGLDLYEDSSNVHGEIQTNWDFLGGRSRVVAGGAYHEQEVDTSDPQGNHTLMLEAKSENQSAVFGQLDFDITSNFKAVIAARWDDSTLHEPQFSPKASLVYSINPNNSIRLNYNEAFQVPNYSEFFLFVPAGPPTSALSPVEAGLAPFLGGVSLGFGSIPILAIGNENLEVEEITSYEIGYSGIYGSKMYLTLDYYRNDVQNFVTDLLGGVNPNFSSYRPPAALAPAVAATVLSVLSQRVPPATLRALTNLPNGDPAIVLSYTNAGEVETQGAEIAVNLYLTNSLLMDFNYSWFDFKVQETSVATGDRLLPNAPEGKFNVGLAYRTPAWDAAIKYRSVDAFDWAAGIFVGPIPSYEVINLNGNYRFGAVTFGINVSNALDDNHYESFGGDILERRALGYISYEWGQ